MGYEIYEQCARSVEQALQVLDTLRQRQAITSAMVESLRLRRRTADIALQATFEELRHAFITPIDREDLLRLRQVTEKVTQAAEDILVTLHRHRQAALIPDDTALLAAVTAECRALADAIEALSSYPHSDTVLRHLTTLESRHRTSEGQESGNLTYPLFRRLSDTCFTAAQTLRYILLKMA